MRSSSFTPRRYQGWEYRWIPALIFRQLVNFFYSLVFDEEQSLMYLESVQRFKLFFMPIRRVPARYQMSVNATWLLQLTSTGWLLDSLSGKTMTFTTFQNKKIFTIQRSSKQVAFLDNILSSPAGLCRPALARKCPSDPPGTDGNNSPL